MESSKGEPDWERSSISRGLNTACIVASSGSLGLAHGGGTSRDEEAEEDEDLVRQCDDDGGGGFRPRRKMGGEDAGEISLREWVDRPERPIELLECLHIFRQIAEAVGLAHVQGVVVANVRPSCFVMSPLSRVAFIDSASCSSSGASDSSCDEGGVRKSGGGWRRLLSSMEGTTAGDVKGVSTDDLADATHVSSVEEVGEMKEVGGSVGCGAMNEAGERKKDFPLKQILLMEFNWYTSPEEAAEGPNTFASDVYRLGVLLFELFCRCDSLDEKLRIMYNLRHRVLPPQLLLKWPKIASFCLWLLHPQPDTRPKMSEVLQSEFLNETRDSLEEREAAIKLREEIEDQELLLEFLLQVQQRKQETADKLHNIISFLSADIEEVVKQQAVIIKNGASYAVLDKNDNSAIINEAQPTLYPAVREDSSCSGSRKRFKLGVRVYDEEELKEDHAEGSRLAANPEIQEKILSKSSRLMKNFKNMEVAYFSTRCRLMKPSNKFINRKVSVSNTDKGSVVITEGSSVDGLASKESRSGWINPFVEGLCKYLRFSKLKVRADLKQGDLLNSSNLVCSLGFDRDRELFATAGVNKKIKIFECDMILNEDRDILYPVVEMTSRSKLSSVCWNSYIKSQIASSDFEGVVQVWDVSRSQVLVEMREHERRVWSVDFSAADPTKLASGSDDGTVKLWNINQGGSIGTIRTKANVCSVQFPPDSARSLAIGSADHKVYFYDLRNVRVPWCTMVGHTKAVSYVKFVDSSTIVSASTDNTLKLWELSLNTSMVVDNPIQTFTGHTNVKNFVGLSLSDGYIATGSETNEVFVYHKAFPMPVLSYKFNSEDPISGQEVNDATQFISCVCWRGHSSTLLAANSSGNIKLLEMI